MKLQTRLSLYSSLVFAIVFTIISGVTYIVFYNYTLKSVYTSMKKTAPITAFFYLEEDELNTIEFDKVKKQFYKNVNNLFYQLYNEKNEVAYGYTYDLLPASLLDEIRVKGSMEFSDNKYFCYAMTYSDNQGEFIVVSREKKDSVLSQSYLLFWILSGGLIIGISSVIIINKLIAYSAYKPIRQVIDEVNKITTENLDTQIKSPGTKDELEDLIRTFNSLLNKLSKSFNLQKNFINYVSHEFKTPLASMMGNLEVFCLKDRSPEEYKILSDKLILQINDLENILSTLIAISSVKKENDPVSPIRIDEIIPEILVRVQERYPNAVFHLNLNISPEDSYLLSVQKQRSEMMIAFFNFIENAVKYSINKPVEITLSKSESRLRISIADKGIGIPPKDLGNIHKPFYRAENSNRITGSGIGLSIALQICENNHIEYVIHSELNQGTTICLTF